LLPTRAPKPLTIAIQYFIEHWRYGVYRDVTVSQAGASCAENEFAPEFDSCLKGGTYFDGFVSNQCLVNDIVATVFDQPGGCLA
tara:strand:- start:10670 stop:10921 length:252 start_codon:yes stop_codon:yes gene_type:complete